MLDSIKLLENMALKALFTCLLSVVLISTSKAATTYYVNGAATTNGSGLSFQSPYFNIQKATGSAIAGDTILIAKGVYYPDQRTGLANDPTLSFEIKDGVTIIGGFDGTETSPEQRDCIANPTVLSGDIDQNDLNKDANGVTTDPLNIVGLNSYSVLRSTGGTNPAGVECMTITGESATKPGGSGHEIDGGGINLTDGPPLTIRDTSVIGNVATRNGGGLNANNAVNELYKTYFGRNIAESGGGIFANGTNLPAVRELSLINNQATGNGGGMALSRSPIQFQAGSQDGPALFAFGNIAGVYGGGIFSVGSMSTLNRAIFESNEAQHGRGLFTALEILYLVNTAFYGNIATVGRGGGIHVDESFVNMINCTATRNRAEGSSGQGGVIYVGYFGRTWVYNSVIKGNTATNGPAIFNLEVCDIEHSSVEDSAGTACTDQGNNLGANSVPDFVVGDKGPHISTRHWFPPEGSPTIDAGAYFLIPPDTPHDLKR